MHILLIHQAFASPNEPGGTRHYELAQKLIHQGHRFTIVASDRSYLTGERPVAETPATAVSANAVRVLRAYTYPSLHRSFFWRVVAFFSFMMTSVKTALGAGEVDLVMGTSPPIFQAISAWLVARIRRRPFLLEIRDLWPEFAIDMGVLRNRLLIGLSRWLERFLYARATHLMVNSPAYRDYLIDKGVAAEKITLIANGVDPTMFNPDARGEQTRAALGLNGQFVITYAGALGMANDIQTILYAADRLRHEPRIHFLMVGDGKERAPLEALAARLQLENVMFAGSRPKSEMAEILAASDVCVATLKNIPMFRTTYPNKVFDYMAAGRPVVLAIDGVIREVVETAQAGIYVMPGDPQALAAAVRYLLDHEEEKNSMSRRGRVYVEQHFNRAEQSRQFSELLETLVAPKSTS